MAVFQGKSSLKFRNWRAKSAPSVYTPWNVGIRAAEKMRLLINTILCACFPELNKEEALSLLNGEFFRL